MCSAALNGTKTNLALDGTKTKRAANGSCAALPVTADKTVTYSCGIGNGTNNNYSNSCNSTSFASTVCNPGYLEPAYAKLESHCYYGTWEPNIPTCLRMCEKLNPINVNLQCYYYAKNIPCDTNRARSAGTIIRPTCIPLNTYRDFVPTYQEIICQDDGKWDNDLFSCVPECGRPYINHTASISGGVAEQFGDSPWHVAVYNEKKILICGGTIIHPYMIISAAHCFYDRINNIKLNSSNYEIVVSKFTREYSVIDNHNQKAFKIREIRFSREGFFGPVDYFAKDIVILILQKELTISPTVLPACVNWEGLSAKIYPPENTPAKVAGWGRDEHGQYNEKLKTVNLPYISRERCLKWIDIDFKKFVTFDRFCAGPENGSSIGPGDSGGGLLIRENNLYYMRGVVSLHRGSAVVPMTDLAEHVDWILTVQDDVDRRIIGLKSNSTLPIQRPAVVNKMCAVPVSTPDKTINYQCNGKQSSSCIVNGFVQESTVASVVCNPGYSTTDETFLESGCVDKKWIPPITTCIRKCEKLTPINVDLVCFRKNTQIPCDLNSLLAGTVIRPTCKFLHTYSSFKPDYIEISCKSDGNWDKPLFSCAPQCGLPYSEASALITGGRLERFGDSPWHVAIYNQDKLLICGGTIIDPQLILSAAHCFSESALSKVDATKYEIAVSKVSRNYTIKDNQNQKIHKIKEIRFSNEKGYTGINNYYGADIAILILQQPVIISPTVLPVCIDWANLNKRIAPLEDTPGKVVGWGLNEHGDYSDNLLTVNLPYISNRRCQNTVPDDFKPFITLDKFCAGTHTGPSVLKGDSGGGYLFRENGLYYIRGIVSVKQPSQTAIAAFTDLADHIQWILRVVNEVKLNLINKETTLQTRTNQTGSGTPKTKKSETIALANCEKYSKYATDCVHGVTSNKGATNALPKEFPHNAYIGIDVGGKVEWTYSGVLISEKFVLSVAHLANTSYGESKWVLLGELDISSKNDDAKPTVFSIVKQYLHPDFKPNSVHNDIALFQLNASVDVVISPYVRPACLYTSNFNPVNKEGKVVAFGVPVQGERNSDQLLRTTVAILNDKRCRSHYKPRPNTHIERGYDPNTMICVGNSSLQDNLCVGIPGSPLQFPMIDQPCVATVYGISAISDQFCDGPDIYIKVPYYLDWIQSIVWP
ncbi:uncharacterized protein LOC135834469 [Planococcus citri]|uniref:uncharacterized protein LOC135834469 n=1 Tax=Planococcus citri TaxID=170843 RepID=UPI0031F94E04